MVLFSPFICQRHLDRGHVVRHPDPGMGEVAKQANVDTFVYTNSTSSVLGSIKNPGTIWKVTFSPIPGPTS